MPTQERWVERISSHVSGNRFTVAEALLLFALDQYPDNGALWLLRATAAFRRGDYDLARRSFEQAGLLVPLDERTQCLLANCYLQTGRATQARSLLVGLSEHASLAILPQLAAGFGQLGDAHLALAMCQRVIDVDPNSAEAHFGVAYYLRRLNYPATFILAAASKAFELEPESLLYRSSVAFLLADLGRQEDAYDLLRDLPMDQLPCACGLRRMKALFQAVGDFRLWHECSRRLGELKNHV